MIYHAKALWRERGGLEGVSPPSLPRSAGEGPLQAIL